MLLLNVLKWCHEWSCECLLKSFRQKCPSILFKNQNKITPWSVWYISKYTPFDSNIFCCCPMSCWKSIDLLCLKKQNFKDILFLLLIPMTTTYAGMHQIFWPYWKSDMKKVDLDIIVSTITKSSSLQVFIVP